MSTAVTEQSVRMCRGCGGEIEPQTHTGTLRQHCLTCRPPRLTAPAKPSGSARIRSRSGAVTGRPFTVAHFVRWARQLVLDNGEQWKVESFQRAFVKDVFSGIEECWLVVPEGNAKSTLVAGMALYRAQHEEYGFIPVAASARDQAGIVYRQAAGFVKRSELEHVFTCQPGYRRVLCPDTNSVIQVYAADASTGDGVIPTFPIVDELHRHPDLELYRTWTGKLGKRGGQIVVLSTKGVPGTDFEETLEAIRRGATEVTRDGAFLRASSPGVVLHEWSVPEDGDVEDMVLVKSANPLRAITVASLARKRARPTMSLPHWRRFTCNLATREAVSAIQEIEWHGLATDDQIPQGEPIWLGLDVAWKWDTTAFVPLWVPRPDYRLLGQATIIEPPRDGTSLDPSLLEQALLTIHARNPVHTVVMDVHRAEQLGAWIATTIGATVVDRGQGNVFAVNDYERWMEAMRMRWLRWSRPNVELTQHVMNAVARILPGGDTRFDRPKEARQSKEQRRRVIDGLSAASMVHATAAAEIGAEPEPQQSWRPL